jgi:hypothetical protein
MAAILAPSPHHPIGGARRPELHVLPGGAGDRPARSVVPYGRRRAVALLLATLLVTGLAYGARAALAPLVEPAPAGPSAAATSGDPTVVVQPGDTVWSIARRARPTGEVRPLVDQLVAAHGPAPLEPGERISIPG